jgi:glycosyltransferase involved in cell wall biosynthesis
MPDIVGNTGFVLQKRNEELLFEIIEDLLQRTDLELLTVASRNRVVENYSFEARRDELLKLLN